MISTNKTQPTPAGEPKELKVLTTNSLRPREFSLRHDFPAINRGGVRKPSGMLTTQNLEERARIAKRAECAAALKAARATQAETVVKFHPKTMGSIRVEHAEAMPHTSALVIEPAKKRGRPKKP